MQNLIMEGLPAWLCSPVCWQAHIEPFPKSGGQRVKARGLQRVRTSPKPPGLQISQGRELTAAGHPQSLRLEGVDDAGYFEHFNLTVPKEPEVWDARLGGDPFPEKKGQAFMEWSRASSGEVSVLTGQVALHTFPKVHHAPPFSK